MASCIQMIQGSSILPAVINQVRVLAVNYSSVLVCLDSNHIHEHVFAESEAYAPLTSMGSYCLASRDTFYGTLCAMAETSESAVNTSNRVDFWRSPWVHAGAAATARIVITR